VPYPRLTLDELKALKLPRLASDCVLFMWTTLSTLLQALELLAAWRLSYHTTITWDKRSGWCMCGFHRKSELLIIGYQGNISRVIKQEGVNIPTVFYEAKTTHSTKPQTIYALIEQQTVGNKIEMFARQQQPGWDAWGNEI
jgi:N6-adenosine-specific RNA methylase IME4